MQLWQDIRYGVRTLRKSPGFSITAIATLALGIGATTANFSVCDAMLWKPLPLPNLDRLAMVMQRNPDEPNEWREMAPADFTDIRQQQTVFEGVAAWDDELCNLSGNGAAPERANRYMVTPNFFTLLGVRPALGRSFAADEDQLGHERVVVLGDALWRRRFAADPAIVGRDIRIDDEGYRVIGVMPPKFIFPMTSELWTPLALKPVESNSRDSQYLSVIGLLKPGLTVSRAEAEAETIASRLAREYPNTNKQRRFFSMAAHEYLIGPYTHQYSIMMFVSVLFVLLIACGNVANLQFARALGRSREVAVRAALGAGRGRLIAQYLTESLALSLAGATLGLLIAGWDIQAILAGMPPEVAKYIPGWYDIRMDQRTLLFTLFAAVASGILAGLVPAWQGTRSNLQDALKEGGRSASSSRGRNRLRGLLVAAEIALSMVLLVGASLMIRGTGALINNSRCFEPSTLLTLRLSITENRYPKTSQQAEFYRQVVDRVSTVPGVRTAFAVKAMPYSGHYYGRRFTIENRVPEPGNQPAGPISGGEPELLRDHARPSSPRPVSQPVRRAGQQARGRHQRIHRAALVAGRAAAHRQALSVRFVAGLRRVGDGGWRGGGCPARAVRTRAQLGGLRPRRAVPAVAHGFRPAHRRRSEAGRGCGGQGHPLRGRGRADHRRVHL
jgi:putative ABC transport system permease protein